MPCKTPRIICSIGAHTTGIIFKQGLSFLHMNICHVLNYFTRIVCFESTLAAFKNIPCHVGIVLVLAQLAFIFRHIITVATGNQLVSPFHMLVQFMFGEEKGDRALATTVHMLSVHLELMPAKTLGNLCAIVTFITVIEVLPPTIFFSGIWWQEGGIGHMLLTIEFSC